MDSILRLPAVTRATGLSRTKLYDLVTRGAFPRPVKLSARTVGWRQSEVVEWIQNLKAA